MVKGGGGGTPGSRAKWGMVPLISVCLSLWLPRGIMEQSRHLMSACFCAWHWVVLCKPY